MDNIADILSSLSSEDMENLKSAASSLLGNFGEDSSSEQNGGGTQHEPKKSSSDFDIDPSMMMKIASLLSKMKGEDKRSNLIKALQPHLNSDRQKKADEAIKMLKLISLLPELKEQGIF